MNFKCKNCGHSLHAYAGGPYPFLHATSRRIECLAKVNGHKCGCKKPEFDRSELINE